tara:strand:- start:735 stop:1070 length:336 start_codon:yes stop_codon:yes gene_type:complete
MDYQSIIKNYTEERKDAVVSFAKANKQSMAGNLYHNKALDLFFMLWHESFPNNPQQKTCMGCRQAVSKFFHNVADFISSERLDAKARLDEFKEIKGKAKKSKKTKKSKSNV